MTGRTGGPGDELLRPSTRLLPEGIFIVLRSTLGAVATVTAALCLTATAAHAVNPAPDCNGYAITDPNGDQFIGARLGPAYPHLAAGAQIDIEGVFFHIDATKFVAHIQVADLPAVLEGTRAEYEIRWKNPLGFGYQGLHADRDAAGWFYSYRTYDTLTGGWRSTQRAGGGAVYTGPDGIVQIELPSTATYATSFGDLRASAAESRIDDPWFGGDRLGTDYAEDFFYSDVSC